MSTLKKRNGIYQYHHGQIRISLKTKSPKIAKILQDEYDLKRLTGQLDIQRMKVMNLIDKYMVFVRHSDTLANSTKRKVLQQVALFASFCKQNDLYTDQITPILFRKYADWRDIASVKNDLMTINKMFTWGQSLGYNLKIEVPVSGYTLKKSFKHRPVTPEEWQCVLHSRTEHLELYKWLYYTGLRPSDVVRVNQSMIKNNILFITPKKTSNSSNISLTIPLHSSIRNVTPPELLLQPYGVCPGKLDVARRSLKSILGDDVTLYSFRYSFNARMKEAGMTLEQRKDAMGHTSIRTTEVYTIPNNDRLDEHIRALD